MNEIKCESEKSHKRTKNMACVGEESYLNELMLNSKSIQKMQDFIKNLD
ncbi:protein of unknown function [Nitrosotalea devaniterrae]|uniref:Uncharacterized protein n=1 Tax=Nitrosotalea devaniterrae TaxID=1078905 RepID=A0A128A2H9_9ARCH|nr:protein of unknown function [Candidatus Nitrosotalea devanaterra]